MIFATLIQLLSMKLNFFSWYFRQCQRNLTQNASKMWFKYWFKDFQKDFFENHDAPKKSMKFRNFPYYSGSFEHTLFTFVVPRQLFVYRGRWPSRIFLLCSDGSEQCSMLENARIYLIRSIARKCSCSTFSKFHDARKCSCSTSNARRAFRASVGSIEAVIFNFSKQQNKNKVV